MTDALIKNEPEENAVEDLQTAIDKIDFDGGIALAGEPVTPTPDPEPKDLEADGTPTPEPGSEPDPEPKDAPEPEHREADPEPTQDPEPEGGEVDKPALSDSHYRAALRMGMQPEEISELYDSSPDLAAKTLAKCYEMVNASSKQLGELGRAARKVQNTPEPEPQPAVQPANTRVGKLVAKVKDHYGDDDPMAEVLTELLKDRQPAVQPQPQQQPDQAPVRSVDEEIAARQQINTFFAADDMTAYSELYGEDASATGDWSHLTPGQSANRRAVCEDAQVLLYGAAAAGMEMSTADALERAHLVVAAPMAEQIVRSRITKSAKRREKGVTLQPNSQRPSERTGGNEYNRSEAIEDVAGKLKEVLG